MSTDETYGGDDLVVLEGLAPVRVRPGMYIGSTDGRGLNHCVWEIIDNAVDEALAGFCRNIEITLNADGSVEVRDDGRGIPVDVNAATGLSGVEVVFTKLHAGGKFGSSNYKTSGGLHGVGASVVNALSERLDATVVRNGQVHMISFSRGEPGVFSSAGTFSPRPGLVHVGEGPKDKSGTTVRFWPDYTIFLSDAAFDLELIYARARQTAFLVPGLALVVRDERTEEPTSETFRFEGGVAELADYLMPGHPIAKPVIISGSTAFQVTAQVLENGRTVPQEITRQVEVEIAARWGNGYDYTLKSFVNIVETPKGGTHVDGFERSLVKQVNEALRSARLLRDKDENVIKDDVVEGLTAVVLVRVPEPEFEGQTKEVLGTAQVRKIVGDLVTDKLKEFFTDSKKRSDAKAILEKVVQAAKARIAARQHKETVRRKTALESSALPAKLHDCRSADVAHTELLIIEGDSAGGTVAGARDSEFQAFLPLKGKPLNVQKATERRVLDNAECAAIITAVGAGSGRSFDLGQSRYGKLIVMADADVDGSHIRTLLMTLVYNYMRPLLEAGRLYAAVPPLHRITIKGSSEHYYTYSDEERAAKIAELEKAGKAIKEVQRYKGLGEMDSDQLAETTLEPAHRKLRRITVADAERAAQYFDLCMGEDVTERKAFIIERSREVDRALLDT